MEKISVIITAYDKHPITVVHAYEAMRAERTPDEVIIINDGGDPCLLEMLKPIKKTCPLKYAYIRENIPWNYPGAVNLGTWLSTGDYLVFEDNDNIPNRTFYKNALELFKQRPEVGRITAKKRLRIYEPTALSKPQEEWKEEKYPIGPNQGTCIMKRDLVLQLKGQDERLSGRYGYMYIDWRARMLSKAKAVFAGIDYYWYVMDVQSDLYRSNSPQNLKIKRENCRNQHYHSTHGILNFSYDYVIL